MGNKNSIFKWNCFRSHEKSCQYKSSITLNLNFLDLLETPVHTPQYKFKPRYFRTIHRLIYQKKPFKNLLHCFEFLQTNKKTKILIFQLQLSFSIEVLKKLQNTGLVYMHRRNEDLNTSYKIK